MNLVYNIKDRPKFAQLILFALQQLLAILAATIAVPTILNNGIAGIDIGMSQSAALFGAGVGTLVYQLFTRFKSPVFLGSSFAFISSMFVAFSGAVAVSVGYLGLILGALMAGLVYVVIALAVKFFGVSWISKLMPPVVIGPTVAIIGLSLAGNAVKDAVGFAQASNPYTMDWHAFLCLLCAIVTLATIFVCSVYGKKMMKLIPFIIGILAGYGVALVLTLIGTFVGVDAMKLIDFSAFRNMSWLPDFAFIKVFSEPMNFGEFGNFTSYLGTVAVAYVPVAFVVFAEHIADHKNLSSIIGTDLTQEPGLHRTLLGDGVGSIIGAIFGGCPNTTYGESVGCVAITRNASVITITTTAIMAIVASFFAPFVTFLSTIPSCVMGGVCISLYGFIAVSGLKMIQKVNLEESRNLFTVSIILICGIGGLTLKIGEVTLTAIACSLILGILTNLLLNRKKTESTAPQPTEESEIPTKE